MVKIFIQAESSMIAGHLGTSVVNGKCFIACNIVRREKVVVSQARHLQGEGGGIDVPPPQASGTQKPCEN